MIYTLVKKGGDGSIESIFSFDVVNSYSESWSGTVSKNTVESGFPIADHINIENPSFDISGKLSTYSIFNDDNEITWDGDDFQTLGEVGSTEVLHLVARENLRKLFLARSALTLLETDTNSFQETEEAKYEELTSGSVNEYDNCVITSINFSIPENSSGGVIAFQIKVEQLNIAYVQTTVLTEDEKQKRIVPKVAPVNTGQSATSTTDSDSPNKPSDKAVAVKGGDPVKANMPAELQKDFDNSETARAAANHIEGGFARVEGGFKPDDMINVKDHGSVINISVTHRK